MKIWVDADATPRPVKEIIFRTANRLKLQVVLVANQKLGIPDSEWISLIQVAVDPDAADKYIAANVNPSDLVITTDIPLASVIVDKGAVGLSPRGELYTPANVKQKLALRDLMGMLRDGDILTGGPSSFNDRHKREFASSLDRYLSSKSK
jgi:uncharacterized protein